MWFGISKRLLLRRFWDQKTGLIETMSININFGHDLVSDQKVSLIIGPTLTMTDNREEQSSTDTSSNDQDSLGCFKLLTVLFWNQVLESIILSSCHLTVFVIRMLSQVIGTVVLTANNLKFFSSHDYSLTATWAGQWLLFWPKQLKREK